MSLLDQLLENTQAKIISFTLNTSFSEQEEKLPDKQQITTLKSDQRPRSVSFFTLSQKYDRNSSQEKLMNKLCHEKSPDQILSLAHKQKVAKSLNKISSRIQNKILKKFYEFWVKFQKMQPQQKQRRQSSIPVERMNLLKEGLDNLAASVNNIEYRKYSQMRLDEQFWVKITQRNERLSKIEEGMNLMRSIEKRIKNIIFHKIQERDSQLLRIQVFQDTLNLIIKKVNNQSLQEIIQYAKTKEHFLQKCMKSNIGCQFQAVNILLNHRLKISPSDNKPQQNLHFVSEKETKLLILMKPDPIMDNPSPQNLDNSPLFILPPESPIEKSNLCTEPNYPSNQKLKKLSFGKSPETLKNHSLFNSRVKNEDSAQKNKIRQHTWKEDKQTLTQIIANLSNTNSPCKQEGEIFRNTLSSFELHDSDLNQPEIAKQARISSNSIKFGGEGEKIRVICGEERKQNSDEQKNRCKQIISLRSKRKNSINMPPKKIQVKNFREYECERINITLCEQQIQKQKEVTPKKRINTSGYSKNIKSSISSSPLQARQNNLYM